MMPDWSAFVRRHLSLPGLRTEREAEIVEDLARQLDDACRDAKRQGLSEADAIARAEQHITDWDALARDLARSSHGRRPVADRVQDRLDDRTIARQGRLSRLAELRQDAFYAWRVMRQGRGITLIAVLSLALGIGANTAIFSVINGLLFRQLAVPHPETLVSISHPEASGMMTGIENGERSLFSYHEYEGLRDGNGVLAGILAFQSDGLNLPVASTENDNTGRAMTVMVSGSYFPVLGVHPVAGQLFGAEVDAARMANPVAVVSEAYWRTRLGADPRAVGRVLRIRRTPFTIVGVLPREFTGLTVGEMPDVFVPLTMQAAIAPGEDWLTQAPGVARRRMFLHVLGRLKPGVSVSQADAALNVTFTQDITADAAAVADPDRRKELVDAHVVVRNARHGLSPLRGDYTEPLVVLMSLVGLLLLLACANVANLLLARAAGRRRELALRVALGANRARLVRQLLTESLLLATAGAMVGVWLGRLGVQGLLRAVSDSPDPIPLDAHLDLTVLAFTIAVTLLTGLLFGVAPAIRATRLDLTTVLRGAATNVAGSGRGTGRWPIAKILAAVQVALSLLLLVTAGLFVRSLQNLSDVPLGYESEHLLMFSLSPVPLGYTSASVLPLYDELRAKLGTIPGVRGVTFSENGIFYGSDSGDAVSFLDDTLPPGVDTGSRFDSVGPGYFATVGIPVLAGRDVEPADGTSERACWLGQTMRQKFLENGQPVGHRMVIHYSFGDATCVIRGIVGDARVGSLRSELPPRFYTSFVGAASKPVYAVFALRVAGEPAAVAPEVRRILAQANAAFATPVFHTVPELIGQRLTIDTLTATLASLFGALALLMAAIGLYGVLSYSVTRRVSEIGVRMALGADRGRILGLIIGEALLVSVLGIGAGLAGALGATRVLKTMLFNLSPRDPMTLIVSLAVLLVVSLLAAALPAWRASRTDPLVALRTE